MQHPFKTLSLIALGKADSLPETLSPGLWRSVYAMGVKQAMIGFLWQGVKRLPEEQRPPQELYALWGVISEKIEEIYKSHLHKTEILRGAFEELGLHACLMKGTSLAALYPEPGCRQSGDIDIWIAGSHKDTVAALTKKWEVRNVLWQECKVGVFDDTVVEAHFHPTKMYNPFLNARLQRVLEGLAPEGFFSSGGRGEGVATEGGSSLPGRGTAADSGGKGYAAPSSGEGFLAEPSQRFNSVFCMAHMFRHYLEGGIGFRQMLDYYFVVRLLSDSERRDTLRDLRQLGMGRFAGAVMFVLQKVFELEEEYMLCPPDQVYGKKLLDEILAFGNFGVADPRNAAKKDESSWKRFIRKNKRVLSYIHDYPREVIWSPFARIRQFLWQLVNRYK